MARAVRQRVGLVLGAVVVVSLVAACVPPPPPPGFVNVTYQPSSENFANPERGPSLRVESPAPPQITWDPCGQGNNFTAYNWTAETPPLSAQYLRVNHVGHSLVYIRYHIAEFRDAPLSDAFLAQLDQDFATARAEGFKIVPRFMYNAVTGGPDAPLARVLEHLDQLGPVLQRNADVLAFMELGFIGCWGEMHDSSNNLVDFFAINDATRAIINKAFAVVPKERMIAIRSPLFKFQFFGHQDTPIAPLTDAQGFDGSIQARWGQHDDCVVCGEWNAGTWWTPALGPFWTPTGDPSIVRNFLHDDNRYVVQAGEIGQPGAPSPSDPDGDGWTSNYDGHCCVSAKRTRRMPLGETGRGCEPNESIYYGLHESPI
jgi:hypothetical protein